MLLVLSGVVSAETRNSQYLDVRSLSMGGTAITTFDDFRAIMYNPASLKHRDGLKVDIFALQVRLDKDVRSMVDFYSDNEELFDNYADTTLSAQQELLDGLAEWDDSWLGAGVYGHIGVQYGSFAIGQYGSMDVEFKTDKGIFEPSVYECGIADIVTTGGLSFEIPASITGNVLPNRLYGGAALKIIKRYELHELRLSASEVNLSDAYDTLLEESAWGYGVDLGLKYELIPNKADLGLRVVDLLADIDDERPPLEVNIGGSMRLSRGILVAADINDAFFHKGESFFNKVHLGAEVPLSKPLKVRAGIGQGYPSVGAGLDFGFIQLDGVVYGTERTSRVGGEGEFNYAFRLKLGF